MHFSFTGQKPDELMRWAVVRRPSVDRRPAVCPLAIYKIIFFKKKWSLDETLYVCFVKGQILKYSNPVQCYQAYTDVNWLTFKPDCTY